MSRPAAFREGADFLVAAASVVELVGRVEVVERWTDPSALSDLTVAGLAGHLGSQVLSVHAAVTAGTAVTDERPVPLLEHYERVEWARSGPDSPANQTIRRGAEESAAVGHGPLVASVQNASEDLRAAFTRAMPVALPPAIRMPGWDWSLSFEDFLVTRVMEIAVHSDDLAVSVGIEPPTLPEAVLGPVLALLVGVSLRRHGQAAVVRALSRSERAPETISAF